MFEDLIPKKAEPVERDEEPALYKCVFTDPWNCDNYKKAPNKSCSFYGLLTGYCYFEARKDEILGHTT